MKEKLYRLTNGIGLPVYFLFWVIIPNQDQKKNTGLALLFSWGVKTES